MRALLLRGGAVWQLVGLITRRSQVQILPPLPLSTSIDSSVASLVESRFDSSVIDSPVIDSLVVSAGCYPGCYKRAVATSPQTSAGIDATVRFVLPSLNSASAA